LKARPLLPYIQPELPLFQFEPITPCPIATVPDEESLFSILVAPFRYSEVSTRSRFIPSNVKFKREKYQANPPPNMHLHSESSGRTHSRLYSQFLGLQRLYTLICTWQQPPLLKSNIEGRNKLPQIHPARSFPARTGINSYCFTRSHNETHPEGRNHHSYQICFGSSLYHKHLSLHNKLPPI
uniref:Uncharacterized protein n=1 Tax=Amazona collaria TaxID=241587 RepID=A0A8B9GFM9_9PSIT